MSAFALASRPARRAPWRPRGLIAGMARTGASRGEASRGFHPASKQRAAEPGLVREMPELLPLVLAVRRNGAVAGCFACAGRANTREPSRLEADLGLKQVAMSLRSMGRRAAFGCARPTGRTSIVSTWRPKSASAIGDRVSDYADLERVGDTGHGRRSSAGVGGGRPIRSGGCKVRSRR